MRLTYVLICLLILCLLPSCSQKVEYVTQTVTEYPRIPERHKFPQQVPIKTADPISMFEALRLGREMRRDFCVLYSDYRELLRTATFGEIVIDRATEDRCPKPNTTGND